MEGIVKICDHCKYEFRSITGQIGGYPAGFNWITITRSSSKSGDKIGAGILHFCCDECLIKYLNKESKTSPNYSYDKDIHNPYPKPV